MEYALQGAAAHIGHFNATRGTGSIPTNSPIVQFDSTLIQSPSIYIQLFSSYLISPPFIIFHFEYLAYEKLHGPEPWRGSLHIHFLSFPML